MQTLRKQGVIVAQMKDVNQTDIADAIRLATRTMGNVFDADDNDTPFFRSAVRPIAYLAFSESFSDAHVPGRHLNALLNAEETINVAIPEEVIEKHARAAFFSYSGPVALPLNRDRVGGSLNRFLPHNLREGFHALYALVAFRESDRVEELAEQSIEAIRRLWSPESGWDREILEGEFGVSVIEWGGPFITGIARAIGPLVKYIDATGSTAAAALVDQVAEKASAEYFTEDGSFQHDRWGTHTHSTTCVMSSLAQLARLRNDRLLMLRVAKFYDNGLSEISNQLGWSIEDCGPEADPDRGEANNTGDILETALILGEHLDPRYYEDAERILRSHLLPSQLRDVSWIVDPENPDSIDSLTNVAERHRGAFGFPAPYGHAPIDYPEVSFNMDIVGGATGSLCEAYRCVATERPDQRKVNMLFDHSRLGLELRTPYDDGVLKLKAASGGTSSIRIPSWADGVHAEAAVPGSIFDPKSRWLTIPDMPIDQWLEIPMQPPLRVITLSHRTRSIRAQMRGDMVTAMDNFGADLTFFPPIE